MTTSDERQAALAGVLGAHRLVVHNGLGAKCSCGGWWGDFQNPTDYADQHRTHPGQEWEATFWHATCDVRAATLRPACPACDLHEHDDNCPVGCPACLCGGAE